MKRPFTIAGAVVFVVGTAVVLTTCKRDNPVVGVSARPDGTAIVCRRDGACEVIPPCGGAK